MDKKQEAELRAQHGDIVVAKVHGKEFAFQTPTDTDYEEFDALEAAFRVQPASAARIADSLSDLAGASVEVTVKKG